MQDWKTTANGILAFSITTLTTVSAFLGMSDVSTGGASLSSIHGLTWLVVGVNLTLALCRAWVGLLQNDAPLPAAIQSQINNATPKVGLTTNVPTVPMASKSATLGVVALAFLCFATLTGCNTFERNAFNTLSASNAVINQAETDYNAKTIPQSQCAYALIDDAKAAQTTAVNAMIVYETEKAAGSSLTAQTAAVTADLATLPALVAQIKSLYTNPAGCVAPKS